MKSHTFGDYLITAEIIIIGMAEAAHLTGIFFRKSFTWCAALFGIFVCVAVIGGAALLFLKRRFAPESHEGQARNKSGGGGTGRRETAEIILYFLTAGLLLSQIVFICRGDHIYRQGDMTVETVGSFLAADSLYRVNPMTGTPYSGGIPSRLKILCLPTLYGSLCRITGIRPGTLIHTIVPLIVLISSYVSFATLGQCLFPEREDTAWRKQRACFLVGVALLLWAGAYRYGMDGFDLLCSGWRGVAIRNGILVPWLFSLCLRKKRISMLLCLLAEACIVWTLYGCGVCLVIAVGMTAAQFAVRKLSAGNGVDASEGMAGSVKGMARTAGSALRKGKKREKAK